jgi:hypothetical protein
MTSAEDNAPRLRQSHIFQRDALEHYVEESWCSARLFEVETFDGHIVDPACGWGTIVINALTHGHHAAGSDLVQRGWDSTRTPCDFLKDVHKYDNIVTNPPFNIIEDFIIHAVLRSRRKTAAIFPLARMPAAHWLERLPLSRVWLLTPRPSMPPGSYIAAGGRVGGGRVDYCWLVFEHGHIGKATIDWLHRDGGVS